MTPDEFYAAKLLENEGWEFVGTSESGEPMFHRQIGGLVYKMELSSNA